jgi:hypothetical protein
MQHSERIKRGAAKIPPNFLLTARVLVCTFARAALVAPLFLAQVPPIFRLSRKIGGAKIHYFDGMHSAR